ncbi:MAG: hypothetical protein U1G05_11535 [Kiritimatiellia bacterium]
MLEARLRPGAAVRLGAGAAARIEEPFHVDGTVRKTIALYQDLLKDNA